MINSVQELDQAMGQLGRMYRVLAGLRARSLHGNPRQFAVLAEGPLDEIRQLREEIDAYAGVREAQANEVDVWMRLEGPRLSWPDVPVSIFAAFLDAFRKGVRTVAGFQTAGNTKELTMSALRHLCDFRVAALEPGSLQVGLRIPEEEAPEPLEAHPVRIAVKEYLEVAAWAGSEATTEALEERFGDPQRLRVLLGAVRQLAPPARSEVNSVELSGRAVGSGAPIRLTRSSKKRIRTALVAVTEVREETHEGVVREIDLDKRSFILRDGGSEVSCTFGQELTESVKQALDCRVRVRGDRRLKAGQLTRTQLAVRHFSLV